MTAVRIHSDQIISAAWSDSGRGDACTDSRHRL